jgi:hypothetical protein
LESAVLTNSDGLELKLTLTDGNLVVNSGDKETAKGAFKDSKQGAKAVALVDQLHGLYKTLDPDEQSMLSSVIYSLQDHWSSSRMLEYYKNRLAGDTEGTDTVVSKAELKDLQDALESAESEVAKLSQDHASALTSAARAQKRILAEALVIFRIASGDAGYKDLSAEQIQSEIDALADRQLVSLKDSIADAKKRLPALASQATTDQHTHEVAGAVADSARIGEDAATGSGDGQEPVSAPDPLAGVRVPLTTSDMRKIREINATRVYESLKNKTSKETK